LSALTVVKFALENGDSKFHEFLKDFPEFFLEMVRNELIDKKIVGMKWDDLILRVEWKYNLMEWLKTSDFKEYARAFIQKKSIDHPCQFDSQSLINIYGMGFLNEKEFKGAIEKDDFKERYAPVRSQRLKEL